MKCDELKVYVPQDGPYGLCPEEGGELVEEETCYLKSEVDAAIAELKASLKESEEARYEAGADAADYYQENRRLRKALYKACANWAKAEMEYEQFDSNVFMCGLATDKEISWKSMMDKCRAKAEEY